MDRAQHPSRIQPCPVATRLIVLALGLALSAALPLAATPVKLGFTEEASVSWVLVPVVVRNRRGYVEDLKAKHFRLWVDDQPQPFETFDRGTDAPFSLIHLQDLSGSMANGGKLEASRRTLRYFLAHARPGDELALASFAAGRTRVEVPFTGETAVIEEALSLWRAHGTTALYDAIAWLPDIDVGHRHLRRGALLITDGADNASELAPETARNMVRAAQLPVYVLALRGNRPPSRAPVSPPHGLSQADVLRQLAATTGGRYAELEASDEVATICAAFLDELRFQYVLGFRSQGGGATAYRRLRVEVEGRHLTITHRQGYRGSAPVGP